MKARYHTIKDYLQRRDQAVIQAVEHDDFEMLKKLCLETSGRLPSSDKVLRLMAHKVCCNLVSMPDELRKKSAEWLKEHESSPDIWR